MKPIPGTLEHKKWLQRTSSYKVLLAVAIYVGALVFMPKHMGPVGGVIALTLMLVAIVSWVAGCMDYARSKGYSGVIGLLGLLTVLGLIVLAALHDKYPISGPEPPPGDYPRTPGSYS